jgi:PAS domain S-box-containing protein
MEKSIIPEIVKILLVEDSAAGIEWVRACLSNSNYFSVELEIAKSLAETDYLLNSTKFQVIIIDLSLDACQGIEAFEEVYKKTHDIPVIVLAEQEDESLGIEAVKEGAQDFLIKSEVEANELKRSIKYSIERHKLMQTLSAKAKELEEKTSDLQNEKQKLALANKIARIGSWEWDLVTGKVTWSDELYELHGLEPAKGPFSFRELLSYIHPDDRDRVWGVMTKSMQTLKPVNFYYRVIWNDRTIHTFYSIGEVVVNEEGKPVKVVGTRQDVTERIQEEELQKLAMVATQSFNSVIIASREGFIEWVNEGFTKLTGYSLKEVKNTHGEVLRKGEQTGISLDTEHYSKVIRRKIPVTYESRNYSKDGKEYWTITTLTPVLDSSGKVGRIIAIDTDITQRKQMEEDLRKANNIADDLLEKTNKVIFDLKQAKKELEETMQVKEQFLANMSHEIRTPMNAIVGFTQLLLKTNPTAEQKQYVDIIKSSGANLLVIVNDILDFSKLHSGKINFEQIEFNLSATINSLIELLVPKSVEKKLKLYTYIDENIRDTIVGDPTRLNQILMNLLSNAIKFTKQGEIRIRVDKVHEDNQNIELMFSVSDTGIGIPEEKLPTIFEAFTQASSETTRKFGGTGLGLAIVKQLVEQQKGAISVNSKLNKGTVFSFTLSFKKDLGDKKMQKVIYEEPVKALPSQGLNVLLVEDNELNAILAEKVLRDWNWKVETTDNGFTAIERIKQKEFDVVLMDIQLPDLDGYETTRRIRKELESSKKDITIIAMTAHALLGEEEKCLEAGMNGYVSKPFEPEQLYLKILTALHINTRTNGKILTSNTQKEEVQEINKEPASPIENLNKKKHTDLTYLRGLAKGSDSFIIQMLNIFIEQTPNAIDRMEKALKSKDWKTLRLIVHKIKPSIMFIGLNEIINEVPILEDYAAEESHLEDIPALVEKIKKVCSEAIGELKSELEVLNHV